jgi:hypothetical protein
MSNDNTNLKNDLVKLQVSQEHKNKQIENLQNDIKNLENKCHSSEIAKIIIEEKFKSYDKTMESQDKRIGNLNYTIPLLAILITIIILIFGFSYGINVRNIAKEEIENWLRKKQD